MLLVFAIAALGAAPLRAQRDLTPLDVVTMRTVSDVFPSPVAGRIAFTRAEPRLPSDDPGTAYTGLYLLEPDGTERPLAAGHRSIGAVEWRPDGSAVTFLERREGDRGRKLYALAVQGGDPVRVFDTDLGIGTFRWRPDGKAVAFTASEPVPETRAAARARGFTQTVVDEDWTPTNL